MYYATLNALQWLILKLEKPPLRLLWAELLEGEADLCTFLSTTAWRIYLVPSILCCIPYVAVTHLWNILRLPISITSMLLVWQCVHATSVTVCALSQMSPHRLSQVPVFPVTLVLTGYSEHAMCKNETLASFVAAIGAYVAIVMV